jgi:hypothetical protein
MLTLSTMKAFALVALATIIGCSGAVASPGAPDGSGPMDDIAEDAGSGDGATSDSPHGDSGKGVDGGGADADGGCHSQADCNGGLFCKRVEDPLCGGAQFDMCQTNDDCKEIYDAGPQVCVLTQCGGHMCEDRCASDASCTGYVTGSVVCSQTSGLCVPKPCSQSSECPTNFSCTNNACQPTQCTSDSQCTGACVNNLCSSAVGTCMPPAA